MWSCPMPACDNSECDRSPRCSHSQLGLLRGRTNRLPPTVSKMAPLASLLVLCFIGVAFAEPDVVPFYACEDERTPEGPVIPRNCEILSLTIDKCVDLQENQPCKVKRTRNAAIEFTFNVAYTLENSTSRAYWANEVGDLPLAGMDTNSCNFTPCPIQSGQINTFSQNLPLSKRFPLRAYDVKWKLENEAQGVRCCFIFKIRLVK